MTGASLETRKKERVWKREKEGKERRKKRKKSETAAKYRSTNLKVNWGIFVIKKLSNNKQKWSLCLFVCHWDVCLPLHLLSSGTFWRKSMAPLFRGPHSSSQGMNMLSTILPDNFSLINVFLQKISPQISEAVPGNWYVSQKLMIPLKAKWETVPEMPSMRWWDILF